MMFPNEQDAVILLYLLVRGPRSSYQIAKDFLSAGVVREPPRSGFKGVVRIFDSRLQRLSRDGYVEKYGNAYAVTPRVFLDHLYLVGDTMDEDLGLTLVLDVNGHYVLYDLDELKRIVPEGAWEQLFVGESIKITSTT